MSYLFALLLLIIALLLINLYLSLNGRGKDPQQLLSLLNPGFQAMEKEMNRIEHSVKDELRNNRTEASQLHAQSRKELNEVLETFRLNINSSLKDFSDRQRENFTDLNTAQSQQHKNLTERISEMKAATEKSLKELQDDNAQKLEEMRATVDEKLQKTLEHRLSESFKLVSERLEAVHKGLGDMQQLATGVGDLKKVLSNVKTRGILGEYQLENILEQLLTPDQYGKNVKPRPGSSGVVEFAIKLPGRDEKEMPVWMPLDSKFPKEDFEVLMQAYELSDLGTIEECRKNFVRGIKKCAAEISLKYVEPPFTTDFALLFLPFESLYAEVLRTPGLFESIQRESKIIITGPTTLSAILSSLQMGFRTLAIEKRSSEVWNMLSSVKSEFSKFGIAIEKTRKKLQEASNVIEQAATSSRQVIRKLNDVQLLPQHQQALLADDTEINDSASNEEEDPEADN